MILFGTTTYLPLLIIYILNLWCLPDEIEFLWNLCMYSLLDRFCPRSTSSKFEGMWEESFNTRVVANQSSRARRFCCFQCWHSKFEIFFKNTRMNHLLGAIHPKINCWITIFVSVRNNSLSINWCILYCIPGLETLHFFLLKGGLSSLSWFVGFSVGYMVGLMT